MESVWLQGRSSSQAKNIAVSILGLLPFVRTGYSQIGQSAHEHVSQIISVYDTIIIFLFAESKELSKKNDEQWFVFVITLSTLCCQVIQDFDVNMPINNNYY